MQILGEVGASPSLRVSVIWEDTQEAKGSELETHRVVYMRARYDNRLIRGSSSKVRILNILEVRKMVPFDTDERIVG